MSKMSDFLEPESIAVFGASQKIDSMGGMVLRNLIDSNYAGRLVAINAKGYSNVFGVPCQASLNSKDAIYKLAILCTPPHSIPGVIRHAANHGVTSIIIMTGGISRRKTLDSEEGIDVKAIARECGVRIIGPNALGIIVPNLNLNASFSHIYPKQGSTAFVGQSAALGSALLDYAAGKDIGLSHVIAVGAVLDVDIAELVDALAADRRVKSILVNVEQYNDPQRLMTALKAASRTKNVLAIRTGLNDQVPAGLKSRHKVDYRFFRRAGVLEVDSLDGLFNGLELLSRKKPLFFESLAIMSNGLSTAMLARNSLVDHHGKLADLSQLEHLDTESYPYLDDIGSNPLVMSPRTDAKQYSEMLLQLDKVKSLGAILIIISPNIKTDMSVLAGQLLPSVKKCRHMVLTCWLGSQSVTEARKLFDEHGLMNFESPNDAVAAFMTMVHHERNQESLRDTPPLSKPVHSPELSQVRELITGVKNDSRHYLTLEEARNVMRHYGFKLVASRFEKHFDDLLPDLRDSDYPVSLRLVHEAYCFPFAYDLNPRMRWRGVSIQLEDQDQVLLAAKRLSTEQAEKFPDSKVIGYSLQPMKRRMDSLIFSMGITRDALVGPLILFGEGGSAADVLADRRFALPPLNANHTRKVIYRSHAFTVLSERSTDLERDMEALSVGLKAMSQLVVDQPEISGLEANILLLPTHEIIVLGVAISVGDSVPPAIAPYPSYLETRMTLKNGQVLTCRPIKAEDEGPLKVFFERMSPEELRYRFFGSRLQFEHRELAAMCQIDYVREMGFVAVDENNRVWGEVRTWNDVLHDEIEFAVMVDPETQGQGFGTQLMQRMIQYGRDNGVKAITAEVMSDNEPMIRLSKGCGFRVVHNEDGVISVRLDITDE